MLCNALVCLDASEANLACQAAAIHFAQNYVAALTGLHVRDLRTMGVPSASGLTALGDRYMEYLPLDENWELEQQRREREAFLTFLGHARAGKVVAVTESTIGLVLEEICRRATQSDIVFLGRGQGAQDSVLGSVASSVVRRVDRPFVLVGEPPRSFERILVAFDGSPGAYRALSAAADIVMNWKSKGTKLRVLTVEDGANIYSPRDMAEAYLAPYGIDFKCEVERGPVAGAITAAAQGWEAGLLCMGAYGHSLLRELMFGSTTQDVVSHWRQPLLLCH